MLVSLHLPIRRLLGIRKISSIWSGKRKMLALQCHLVELTPRRLKKDGIISEVIDDFTPKCFVTPYYGKKEKAVAFGNKFKKSKTKERPSVKIYCPDIHVTPGLTVALTDPDAPSRDDQKWSEMCHWISPLALPDPKSHIDFIVPNDSDEEDLVDCENFLLDFCQKQFVDNDI